MSAFACVPSPIGIDGGHEPERADMVNSDLNELLTMAPPVAMAWQYASAQAWHLATRRRFGPCGGFEHVENDHRALGQLFGPQAPVVA